MNRSWLSFALLALSGMQAVPAVAQTNYLLELSAGTDANALASKYSLTVLKSWQSGADLEVKVSATAALLSTVVTAVRAEPGVLDFETDATLRPAESDPASKASASLEALGTWAWTSTSVPYYGSQVRYGYVNQPAAQIIELASAQLSFGTGVGVVAIVDTGIDPTHPALQSSLLTGYDFTRDQPGASELADLDQSTVAILDQSAVAILDSKILPVTLNQSTVAILDQSTVAILDGGKLPSAFGHGTMVAGLVHLVAPTARILPLKAFNSDGSAALSDIVRAIRYAADNGANVISMSFTLSSASSDLQAAVAYAQSKGIICVASTGNDGKERSFQPAALPQVIGVGSTNFSDKRSSFSNYDDAAFTSAPGEALITTYPGNNYAGVWGTSFSTALVSGGITLLNQIKPNVRIGYVRDAIDAGVHIDQDMGDARLDLVKSLTYCLLSHD